MKKNKRHLYKRLPKYALGTMKPMNLGYLRGMIGSSAKFDTEQNMSLEPETQAIRKSALPNALGYVAQLTPYVTEMLKSLNLAQSIAPSVATSIAPNTSSPSVGLLNTTNISKPSFPIYNGWGNAISGIPTALDSTGSTITNAAAGGFSYNLSKDAINALNKYVGDSAIEHVAKEGAKNAGTSTLGTALGAVGTAIGGYTMANQIAGFGDHRSAQDMLANVGRSHVTTDYGNQYTAYNGVNAGQELGYEKANARSKQLGFGMNTIGTGASLGGLLASTGALGSIGGPLGTAIGAGVGLLVGGLGSLFGWGDNSDEIERLTKLTNDNIANYNRQQEAVAKSKDVAAEFSDRQGIATAAVGKNAFGPMTSKKGDNINTPRFVFDIRKPNNIGVDIPSSLLTPGETAVNKEDLSQWAVVPGKGNKDNVYSAIKPGDSNVVLTKKEGISKLGAAVLKSNAPESLKRWLINELEKRQLALLEQENQTEMKKYKNGKLPGFWRGTDYLMSAIPHLAALGGSWNLYNRAKYADMPDYPNIVDSSANTQAINILGRRRFNPAPLLEHIHRTHRNNLYDINRTPGLTAGGQAIARANNTISEAQRGAEVLAQADEINNKYTADYANALANYGKMMSEMMTNNNYARAAFKQHQNAAKEGWMAQYEKNGLTALADLASDVMGVRQFNRSEDYQNRMLKLYNQQVENDKVNAQATLANAMQARLDREAAYNKVVKETIENTHPMFLNQGIYRPDGLWNLWGNPVFNYKLTYPQVDQKYAKYFKPF